MKQELRIKGIVKKNFGRGKSLGFPTANIDLTIDVESGLYLGWVEINPSTSSRQKLASLIFVGANETFGETEKKVEVYILDFKEDLYGQEISVEIIKKMRDVIKFNSPEELIEQMKKDEKSAREYFKSIDANIRINTNDTNNKI